MEMEKEQQLKEAMDQLNRLKKERDQMKIMLIAKDQELASTKELLTEATSSLLYFYGSNKIASSSSSSTTAPSSQSVAPKKIILTAEDLGVFRQAASDNDIETMQTCLLTCNLDINQYKGFRVDGWGGFTTLHMASMKGHISACELLLNHQADINIQTLGKTPLIIACSCNQFDAIKYLTFKGCDINLKDDIGRTALQYVSEHGHLSAIEHLLNYQADIDAKENDGCTALFKVIIADNHMLAMERLLNHQADIHARDNRGNTPLMKACSWGKLDAVKYLISKGSHLHAKNYEGKTALAIAREEENMDIVEYLKSFEASAPSTTQSFGSFMPFVFKAR